LVDESKILGLDEVETENESSYISLKVGVIVPVNDFVLLHSFDKLIFLFVVTDELIIECVDLFFAGENVPFFFNFADQMFEFGAELLESLLELFVDFLDVGDFVFHFRSVDFEAGVEVREKEVDFLFFL
jgi:hypothetical protein